MTVSDPAPGPGAPVAALGLRASASTTQAPTAARPASSAAPDPACPVWRVICRQKRGTAGGQFSPKKQIHLPASTPAIHSHLTSLRGKFSMHDIQ